MKPVSDWDGKDWLDKILEVELLAEQVKECMSWCAAAVNFSNSVQERLASLRLAVENYGGLTEKQGQMLFNIERGLRKWSK